MNTLFIIVLFIAEIINLFWTIFLAPDRIDASAGQQIGWIILSGILFIIFTGYFLQQEEEDGKKKNQSKIGEK